jgi:hypothetical protein
LLRYTLSSATETTVRDVLAFGGAIYGTAVGIAGTAALLVGQLGLPLRFGAWGTGGIVMMGAGVAAYSILKFAHD